MSDSPVKVGLIGCGKISGAYFEGCSGYENIEIVACADLDLELARRTAEEQGFAFGGSVDDLLARPEIEIVINLTIPIVHAAVNRRILAAGKHAYTEKPFALSTAESAAVVSEADAANLRIGSAPDTFLGSGLQTARRFIDEGLLGIPVAAMGFMLTPGHETWHPNPDFYYQRGGGPMWDMGPYYITALVNLLGPVARVSGVARKSFEERTITSEPRQGEKIPVDIATHFSTTLEFASGVPATLFMSFDTQKIPSLPNIMLLGTKGNLRVCDPNWFDETCSFAPAGSDEFEPVENKHTTGRGRGSGVADLADAIRSGRLHRANGTLAHHVVEVMEAATRSSQEGRHIAIESTCERPAPVPSDLPATQFKA